MEEEYGNLRDEKIEALLELYKEFIEDSDEIEVVFSEKLGYIFCNYQLNRGEPEFDDVYTIESAEDLAEKLANEEALITMFEIINSRDEEEEDNPLTTEDRDAMEKVLLQRFADFPEYHHLIRPAVQAQNYGRSS